MLIGAPFAQDGLQHECFTAELHCGRANCQAVTCRSSSLPRPMSSTMKDLLPYFERDLTLLRRYAAAFAAKFPGVAGRLREGDSVPHVDRLLQGVALLSARISKRVDDG